MKVLLVHNQYLKPGGEESVVEAETKLLESKGHTIKSYFVYNNSATSKSSISLAVNTLWNKDSYKALSEVVKEEIPDLVHIHNFFPLISPSVHYAVRSYKIPLVQTLHNYRLLCANGLLMREDKPCESCIGKKIPWKAIYHSCYHRERLATSVVAGANMLHHTLGTWSSKVNVFLTPSQFAKNKFVEARL